MCLLFYIPCFTVGRYINVYQKYYSIRKEVIFIEKHDHEDEKQLFTESYICLLI